MQLVLALVICFLLCFLFWFLGQTISKKLEITEDNKLLKFLINFAFGATAFLIVISLVSNITKDFNWGLIISFFACSVVAGWQFNDFKNSVLKLKNYFEEDNFSEFVKQNTDRYFWILVCALNLIYGLTAYATNKLEHYGSPSSHMLKINQLIDGNYPPIQSCSQVLENQFNFGSDILAAIISKFTNLSPEISLDILTLISLNLAILVLYGLSVKLLHSVFNSQINKFLVILGALIAWGPVTKLFSKEQGEFIPSRFFEKLNYLTQTRLIDSAGSSGLVLHWFFAPDVGLGVFFYLIALYLIFQLFEQNRSLKYSIVLGVFLSSLLLIDISKFALIVFGVLLYLLFSQIHESTEYKIKNKKDFFKSLAIVFIVAIILGLISGNLFSIFGYKNILSINKEYLNDKYGPISTNTILLAVYAFGFYQAYKLKQRWLVFTIPFFAGSLILPCLITIPGVQSSKFLMAGNVVAAFSLPVFIDIVLKKYNLKGNKLLAFYLVLSFLLGGSTLMFFAFGDRTKPVFRIVNGSLKFTGKQELAVSETQEVPQEFQNDLIFTEYLRSKKIANQIILTEKTYVDLFPKRTRLCSLLSSANPPSASNQKEREEYEKEEAEFRKAFSFDKKFWHDKKINWIYMTPKLFRFMLPPQAKMRLLNAYLNNGLKLQLSNSVANNPIVLRELYDVNPKQLSPNLSDNFPRLLGDFLKSTKEDIPVYMRQIALCPYLGVYNAMSNDFDGDKIADIAFFNQAKKSWVVIYGKNNEESEFDLSGEILSFSYDDGDLLIPIPSDYDGDSKTDIALFNRSKGSWHVLKSSDSQLDRRMLNIIWSRPIGEVPVPADVDGDSKTDNSCFDSINAGAWHSYLTSNNNYFANGFSFSVLDIPAHIDIDGDKKADYVIYKPGEKVFIVYLSTKNFDQGQALQVSIGELNSRIAPADYDGDGRADLATWDPETGKWEIAYAKDFLSGLKGGVSRTFTLGKAGDIPMPGDYNGDSKAEAAVYSLTNSELEILFNDGMIKKINFSKFKNYIPASFIGI